MSATLPKGVRTLAPGQDIWESVFVVSPLVIVGTRETGGEHDLAPKHRAMVLGEEGHYLFGCTPAHGTYRNARREGFFTVSYPIPSQIVLASLAAAPRCDDGAKPHLQAIPVFPATRVEGVLVRDSYLFLECETDRVIDGFGSDSLVVGRIVAAHVDELALRNAEIDDQEIIHQRPLLTYLSPGRYAEIDASRSFPFPEEMSR